MAGSKDESCGQRHPGHITIEVKVVPNSAKRSVDFSHEPVRVMLTSPPKKGRANRELVELFEELLCAEVRIVKGLKKQRKVVEIRGDEHVIQKLRSLRKKGKGKEDT